VRRNKLDLLVILLPFLRPIRVLGTARGLRVLRSVRAATFLGRAMAGWMESWDGLPPLSFNVGSYVPEGTSGGAAFA
jgi:hypothetical protein